MFRKLLDLKNRQIPDVFKAWMKGRYLMGMKMNDDSIPVVSDAFEKELKPIRAGSVENMLTSNGFFFTGRIYLYAYVREDKETEDSVCMDFYFVNSPVNENRKFRAAVKKGYRLDWRREMTYLRLIRQGVLWDRSNKREFLYDLKERNIRLPDNAEKMDESILLDCLYASFAGKRIKRVLYEEGYYKLGSQVEFFLGINKDGKDAEEITGLPRPLLELYEKNYRELEAWICPGNRKAASDLYRRYEACIGDIFPDLFRWRYLEEIDEFGGEFDKEVYERISDWSPKEENEKKYILKITDTFDSIKRFCKIRSKLSGICRIDSIPDKEDFDDVMDIMETAYKYLGSEDYILKRVSEIYDESYMFSDEKYIIMIPKDLSSFINEELVLRNGVMALLYGVLLGDVVLLFIHRKDKPEETLGYIDIGGDRIINICMKDDEEPDKKVKSFVKKYAKAKGFVYGNEKET